MSPVVLGGSAGGNLLGRCSTARHSKALQAALTTSRWHHPVLTVKPQVRAVLHQPAGSTSDSHSVRSHLIRCGGVDTVRIA
jgi:hypothetical protein